MAGLLPAPSRRTPLSARGRGILCLVSRNFARRPLSRCRCARASRPRGGGKDSSYFGKRGFCFCFPLRHDSGGLFTGVRVASPLRVYIESHAAEALFGAQGRRGSQRARKVMFCCGGHVHGGRGLGRVSVCYCECVGDRQRQHTFVYSCLFVPVRRALIIV